MHELFLLIMVMIFTLATMFGLVFVFRGWMAERDRLIDLPEARPSSRMPAD
jgi:hypothetical protein